MVRDLKPREKVLGSKRPTLMGKTDRKGKKERSSGKNQASGADT